MLELRIGTGEVSPGKVNPGRVPFQEWRDVDGTVVAYGYTTGGDHWMQFPGLATFQFSDVSDLVVAAPEDDVGPELIRDTYARAVLPLVLHTRGQEALHASAVVAPTGVVAFCGRSEMGKSTIAYGLGRRGHAPFSDDALVLRRHDRGWEGVPYPFRFRLRAATATHFTKDGAAMQPAGDMPDRGLYVADEPLPLVALILLTKLLPASEASAPVTLNRLRPAAAFPLILPHAYCFSLEDPGRKRKMAEAYLDLAAQVPAYDLRYAGVLDTLPAILDKIEAIVSRPVPPHTSTTP